MTILPHDRHLSNWQRAIARLQALIDALKQSCTDDHMLLPDWWKPNQIERSGRASDG
jgi:hypothetical protein